MKGSIRINIIVGLSDTPGTYTSQVYSSFDLGSSCSEDTAIKMAKTLVRDLTKEIKGVLEGQLNGPAKAADGS